MKIYNIKSQKQLRQKLRNERPVSERLLWSQLRNSQLGYKFRRQQGVGKYIVDFFCPELKLVIEIDGATHETEEEIKQDKIRQIFLESLGLKILRYRNLEIKEGLGGLVQYLIKFLKERDNEINHPQEPPPNPSFERRGDP
ncbi:MAG: endonuclease domain-containing protein [Patescibacteria group bacterium]|nr:endonuclease domain-containing protein [Patescibacteria group bacterium]